MKAEKLLGLSRGCMGWMSLKGAGIQFYDAIMDIQDAIYDHVEKVDRRLKEYNRMITDYRYEYGTKIDGKLQYEGHMVKGLLKGQQPDFDKLAKEIEDKKEELFNKDIEIEINVKINKKSLPQGYDGNMYRSIKDFLE